MDVNEYMLNFCFSRREVDIACPKVNYGWLEEEKQKLKSKSFTEQGIEYIRQNGDIVEGVKNVITC